MIVTCGLVIFAYRGFTDTRILQRAYLSVEPQGIHGMIGKPGELVAHVMIANAGNLPARSVKWKVKSLFSDTGEADDSKFVTYESELAGNNVLPPKGKMIQGSESMSEAKMLREQDEIRRFRGQKEHFLYIYGLVTYEDGFGKTQHIVSVTDTTVRPSISANAPSRRKALGSINTEMMQHK